MLEDEVLNTIKKYNLIEEGDKVIVRSFTDGPDSICLVNILYNLKELLKISLIICHINHLIREESDEDEEFVKTYSENKNIPFESEKIDIIAIASEKKISTEEAGREARYKFFKKILEKYNGTKIATAHTKGDNVETVLMNIIRGTGMTRTKGNYSQKR